MFKIALAILAFFAFSVPVPEVKVAGAMRNIMMEGDLSAHINLDTLNKKHLYGLGPVADLKGELVIVDGRIYSTAKRGKTLNNQQNQTSLAAMLVYSKVEKWKAIETDTEVKDYATLEELVEQTAEKNGYDTEGPFAFRITTTPQKADFHVIDWKKGVEHTMDNHKQFAYTGSFENKLVELVGFYSKHHKSIFTHHTTNVHVHVLELKSGTVGHLDGIQLNGKMTIYLPEK